MSVESGDSLALEQRHKKERKDLQAKITALKHSVSKTDKKRKAQLSAEIAILEAELDSKHQKELAAAAQAESSVHENVITENGITEADSAPSSGDAPDHRGIGESKKVSKAQKRREKKDAEARERNRRISEGEKEAKHGARHKELEAVDKVLKERDLQLFEIQADGDCLFNALAHQLFLLGISCTGEEVRQNTAQCLKTHPDEFMPFLLNENTGDLMSPAEYQAYCDKIAKPTVWGGQPEIKAFSMCYQHPVEIIQGDAAAQLVGEEFVKEKIKPLVIAYHRHAFRLGEHYNSAEPRNPDDDFEKH